MATYITLLRLIILKEVNPFPYDILKLMMQRKVIDLQTKIHKFRLSKLSSVEHPILSRTTHLRR